MKKGLLIKLSVGVPLTLDKKQSQEFVSWLKERGDYDKVVSLFLSDQERAQTLLSGLLLTWMASREK